MSRSKAAIRYAKAVMQQASETNSVDTVFGDMKSVDATIDASKELRAVLKSPVIKANDKKEALLKIFNGQSSITADLINVLVANGRTDILGDVAKGYVALYNETKGVKVVKVTTAVPLTSEIEAQVLSKVESLTGSSAITIENDVDESIIGGFILRMGDLQYNASIANQFGNLKREFSKSL